MARAKTRGLTDGEARVMAVLWARKQATVGDVQETLRSRHDLSYSTVQTMLRILEAKGYVSHEKSGRAFVYRPVVDQRQARRRALRHLLARMFNNSPGLLVLNVLEDEHLSADDMRKLKELIRDA